MRPRYRKNLLFVDLHHTAASTILGVTYGYTPHDANDKFIRLAHEAALESFRYGGPGSSICDLIPFCKSLFFYARPGTNRVQSEILADMDAVFILSEARRLHQDGCGEDVQLTARMDGKPDGIQLGYFAGLTDSVILRLIKHIKV